MKKFLIISLFFNLLFISVAIFFIHKKGGIEYVNRKLNSSSWKLRKTLFGNINEIVFLGNSITEQCDWDLLLNKPNINNRGIGGDNTKGILARLDEEIKSEPLSVFIAIGVNDLREHFATNIIIVNYDSILTRIKLKSPKTKIFVESILPVTDFLYCPNDSITILNKKLKSLCLSKNVPFIDTHSYFLLGSQLNPELTRDGIHLNPQGYVLYAKILKPYLIN